MNMPLPALENGVIPHGRWRVTIEEAQASVEWGNSSYRQAIWSEWETLTAALKQAVGTVPACWMGGSFFTDKEQPGDIDCLYLIEDVALERAFHDPTKKLFVNAILGGRAKNMGLRVDAYVLPWVAFGGTQPDATAEEAMQLRGYWDYFWSKMRPVPGDPRSGALPRRGYLEVILDDFR